jgi:hypothetical protein
MSQARQVVCAINQSILLRMSIVLLLKRGPRLRDYFFKCSDRKKEFLRRRHQNVAVLFEEVEEDPVGPAEPDNHVVFAAAATQADLK